MSTPFLLAFILLLYLTRSSPCPDIPLFLFLLGPCSLGLIEAEGSGGFREDFLHAPGTARSHAQVLFQSQI